MHTKTHCKKPGLPSWMDMFFYDLSKTKLIRFNHVYETEIVSANYLLKKMPLLKTGVAS